MPEEIGWTKLAAGGQVLELLNRDWPRLLLAVESVVPFLAHDRDSLGLPG
jgi:hypothetical protein